MKKPSRPGDQTQRSLRVAAVRGMAWLGGNQISRRVVAQIVTVILARLLVPRDFGLFSMAILFILLQERLTSMGLDAAIIQRRDIDDEYLSTAFWVNVGLGAAFFAVTLASSKLLGAFFGEPALAPIIVALSTRFLLVAGSATQMALLLRRMDYRALSLRSTAATVIGGVTGVGMAYAGMGVWSLVGQALGEGITGMVLVVRTVRWFPRPVFSWPKFRELWSFSAPISASRLCTYLVRNVDNLLVGRYLGAKALGFYSFGYTIFLSPLGEVLTTVYRVILPIISTVHGDRILLRRGVLLATKHILLVGLPIMTGISVLATPLLESVFGARWLPSAPVLSILAMAGFLEMLAVATPGVLQATGRPDLQGRTSVLSVLVFLPAFGIGVRWGIVGVSIGYLAARAVLTPIQLGLVMAVAGITTAQMWSAVRPSVVGCAAMAAVLAPAAWVLRSADLPTGGVLTVLVMLGSAVYGSVVWILHKEGVIAFAELFCQTFRGGRRLEEVRET